MCHSCKKINEQQTTPVKNDFKNLNSWKLNHPYTVVSSAFLRHSLLIWLDSRVYWWTHIWVQLTMQLKIGSPSFASAALPTWQTSAHLNLWFFSIDEGSIWHTLYGTVGRWWWILSTSMIYSDLFSYVWYIRPLVIFKNVSNRTNVFVWNVDSKFAIAHFLFVLVLSWTLYVRQTHP